jgi:hypothetical protein
MAQQYPGNWKQCATCAFWTGNRECDYFGQRVTVASGMEKGKCAIPKGGWKNQQKQANSQCGDWQKWPVLK